VGLRLRTSRGLLQGEQNDLTTRRVPCGCPAASPGAPAPRDRLPGWVALSPLPWRITATPLSGPLTRNLPAGALVPSFTPPLRVALSPVPGLLDRTPLRVLAPPARAPPLQPPLRLTFPLERLFHSDCPCGLPSCRSLPQPSGVPCGSLSCRCSVFPSLAVTLCVSRGRSVNRTWSNSEVIDK
jgi:hypothetical protein